MLFPFPAHNTDDGYVLRTSTTMMMSSETHSEMRKKELEKAAKKE
jgi:hypothetical protein